MTKRWAKFVRSATGTMIPSDSDAMIVGKNTPQDRQGQFHRARDKPGPVTRARHRNMIQVIAADATAARSA